MIPLYESGATTLPNLRVQPWMSCILRLLAVVALLLTSTASAGMAAPKSTVQGPVPVLAYYYIWFDTGSWDRAKTDIPALGRYSSDDKAIMQEHIRLAKQAGIDGFIVSWKSTETLNRRLQQLVEVADAADFKLAIIYEGLNFERKPLPATQISADLDYFIKRYKNEKAFDIFTRPLVIWSGTWEFRPDVVAQVTGPLRAHVLLLSTERRVDNYERIADFVDGNAYYWSSVDPDTFPNYQEKLDAMGKAAHAHGGLWIAPAAPGFDARLIGGTRIVDRKNGATLRQQMDVAIRSSPDAVGLISWNEFTENSHVEPSVNYGTQSLEVLADIRGTVFPKTSDFDSSEPGDTKVRPGNLILLSALLVLVIASVLVIAWRGSRKRKNSLKALRVSSGDDTSLS
jgi:hypothetical protein